MSMAEKSEKKTGTITINLEKLTPIFVLLSIVLAFVVGMLWQKVKSLESGVGTPTTTNNQVAQQSAQEKRLTDLPALAESVGVDKGKFESCVSADKYSDRVEGDYQDGINVGVNGTPSNFLVNSKGEIYPVPGAVPYATLKSVIDVALGDTTDTTGAVTKLAASEAASFKAVSVEDHLRGDRDAELVMVEYSDFQCPFCQNFHATALQALSEYDGRVAWVYRHFPLDNIHPYARPAAEASECVAELGGDEAFWKFADEVFAN